MKRVLSFMLCVLLVMAILAGCGGGGSSTSAQATPASTAASNTGEASSAGNSEKRHLVYAWCVDNIDLSQQYFIDTIQAYADYLSRTRDDISVEVTLFDGLASVEKQISDIETAVAMGVDGIILSCVDPDGIRPAAEKAMAEGIEVVDWRNMGDVCTVTYVGADEQAKGRFSYEWTKQYLIDNPDVVLYAGLQQGSPNHPQTFPRMEYLEGLAEEMPDQFKVLVTQNSDWSAETSMKMVEDWLQAYPEMNFISSASEEQMMGCVEALRGEGVLEDFILTTHNGETPGVEMLEKKEIMLDVGVVNPVFCQLLLETAIRATLEGFTGHVDMSDQTMFTITQDNVEEYKEKLIADFDNGLPTETTLKDSYL